MVSDITFLWFLLFSMCHSLHVAVNNCINWCFVHLSCINSTINILNLPTAPAVDCSSATQIPYVVKFKHPIFTTTWRKSSTTLIPVISIPCIPFSYKKPPCPWKNEIQKRLHTPFRVCRPLSKKVQSEMWQYDTQHICAYLQPCLR